MHAFSLVHKEFERSGISQADLALRTGKGADRICRLLGAPGNWTADTVSDLLFAISGAEVSYGLSYPIDKPPRNQRKPEWLEPPSALTRATTTTTRTSTTVSFFAIPEGGVTPSTSTPQPKVILVDA